ncbi:hypothetical protein F2Q70_00029187 [Brassica cretica]|uniref:Uncharacterized protein n=1 Tax=Brassica cretica TaxID=69181 RepID=A0A8S9FJV5_BRACR|nr:hypothetical protein F2Q70_00029187 [Brassica cretica]
MTNDNNTAIDTTNVIQIPLNVAATDATVTTVGNITVSTAAATTTTTLSVGNVVDEITRCSLFGVGLYQTGSVSGTASGPVAVQTPPNRETKEKESGRRLEEQPCVVVLDLIKPNGDRVKQDGYQTEREGEVEGEGLAPGEWTPKVSGVVRKPLDIAGDLMALIQGLGRFRNIALGLSREVHHQDPYDRGIDLDRGKGKELRGLVGLRNPGSGLTPATKKFPLSSRTMKPRPTAPGRTPISGSPLRGTPVPRYDVLRVRLALEGGGNLNYVIMVVDEQDELPEATQREANLQRQIDGLHNQVTELHKTREETNPELSSEFHSLKEKLNEHSKQLEQCAEKPVRIGESQPL